MINDARTIHPRRVFTVFFKNGSLKIRTKKNSTEALFFNLYNHVVISLRA